MPVKSEIKKFYNLKDIIRHAEAVAVWEAMNVDLDRHTRSNFNWENYREDAGCDCKKGQYCEACLNVAIRDQRFSCETMESSWLEHLPDYISADIVGDYEAIWEKTFEKKLAKAVKQAAIVFSQFNDCWLITKGE